MASSASRRRLLVPETPTPEIPDLLRRINALLARGDDLLLFRERELYAMTGLVNRYTKAPLRFVAGLSLMIRAFEDPYGNLEGRRFEGLARLFAQNVRIYVYPMAATDLQEWMQGNSVTGWNGAEPMAWCPHTSCDIVLLSVISTHIFSRTISLFRWKHLRI